MPRQQSRPPDAGSPRGLRRGRRPGVRAALVLAAVLGSLTAACSGDEEPQGAPTPTPTGTVPGTAAPPPPPATTPPLPPDCAALAPASRLVEALARPLPGPGAHVAQGPEPGIGRAGRVTCTYGPVPAEGFAPLQISLADYDTAATAAGRVDATVERAAGRGDRVGPQAVGDLRGFFISGAEASSFVLAQGATTLVATLATGVVPDAASRPALGQVVAAVLEARAAAATPGPR